ncbi:MAG: TadE/TadG family type IV pilus assembly protein, partial [Terriglobales bacterium]
LQPGQKGGTLLEGALTLLIFFMLIFGVLEFGRAYNLFQVATNAAREGARLSVAPFPGTNTLPTNAEVQARVQQFLTSAGARGATVVVSQAAAGPVVNSVTPVYTQVDVTVPYTFLFFKFGTYNLRTSVRMRNENSP